MPSVFDQRFGETAFYQLLAQFGESVTYTLRGGEERTFNAIIEREPPALLGSDGDVVTYAFLVRFRNDATDAVARSEINVGGDLITLVPKLGSASTDTYQVLRVVSQDSGVVQVAVK